MSNILKLSFGLCILIFSGCTKDENCPTGGLTNEIPSIPSSIEIDVDDNGTVDYRIEYSQVLVESPCSSSGIVGSLKQYDENEILNERQGKDLFLRDLEEIKDNVVEPLFWSKTSNVSITSVYNHDPTTKWQAEWDVNSKIEHSSYFIGLNLISDDIETLAWLELEINTNNGNISIINKGIL